MENQQNLQKTCIIVCVGIPAAGKTTFCKELQEIHQNTYGFLYFNYDDSCNGDFSYEKRKEILQIVERRLHTAQTTEINRPIIVLIDDNMFYRSMRSEFKRMARKYRTSFLQLYFEVRLEIALERNRFRDSTVPEEIIHDMIKKLEIPDKNCYKINSNIIFSDMFILQDIRKVIDESLEHPIEQKIPEKCVVIEENKLQRIDLILRQIVSEKIKENKSKALEFINRRKEVLAMVKEGEICISDDLDSQKLHLTKYFV